ncbi:MAG: hypothetical protein ABIP44_04205 [Pseudoxanthomonas sp.]
MKRLLVAGVALRGGGYPNAERTLAILADSGEWELRDHAHWLPPHVHLWRLARGSLPQRIALAFRLGVSGLLQALAAACRVRADEWVYLPYPAPLTLWWLSFCPARWRPRCIADAYISIWDSMFRDRRQGVKSQLSRMVHAFEQRSLRAAQRVLVDTQANRQQMIEDFGLQPERVVALPLAIDEQQFLAIPAKPCVGGARLRVIFVGTLVPLHGIEVVLDAVSELAGDDRFDFRLVGDGQLGAKVEAFIERKRPANFAWLRNWRSLEEVANEIADADICLGVFAGGGKAARVLPFKLYMYLASGRAVITQVALSMPGGVPAPPVCGIDPLVPGALAQALRKCAVNQDARDVRARDSRCYYLQWLANGCVADAWRSLLP